jgi:hypothetical protein
MKLIGNYNFAKAQNPQVGGKYKIKIDTATVEQYAATKKILNKLN